MNTNNNFTISGHHVEITPTLEEKIQSIIAKLTHKFDHVTSIHVTLKIEGNRGLTQKAEAELKLCGGKQPIFAEATSIDMYQSLDELEQKLNKLIVKHKELLKTHGEQHNHHRHHNQIKQSKK